MMASAYLSKKGYGSIKEILSLDTPEYLDLLEYEEILQCIENYEYEKARNGG